MSMKWLLVLVAVLRSLILAAETSDLLLYSASPTSILESSTFINAGSAIYLAVTPNGKFGFIGCLGGGMAVIDLQDVTSPKHILQVQIYSVNMLDASDTHVFVSDGLVGLVIFDLSELPNKINQIATLNLSQSVSCLKLVSERSLVLLLGNGVLFAVDISNINQPILLSQAGDKYSTGFSIDVNSDQTRALASQGTYGVGIYDISDLKNIRQLVLQTPFWIIHQCIQHPDKDIIYVVDYYYGLYLADISAYLVNPLPATLPPLEFKLVLQYPGNAITNAAFNKSKKYLVISVKSIGLKFFDITSSPENKLTPKITYSLNGGYFLKGIVFSQDDEYLYFTNGLQFLIHSKVTPQLNNDFPNVFNTFSSRLTQIGHDFWPYHVHMFSDGLTTAVNVGLLGTKIFDISDTHHPVLLSSIPSQSSIMHDFVYAQPSNENILYIGASQIGILIFDITDKKNPQLLSSFCPVLTLANNSDGIDLNEDRSIVAIANQSAGVTIADFTDLLNPRMIAVWPSYLNTLFSSVKLSKNSQFIFTTSLELGMAVLDISNPSSPIMVALVNKMVGEDVILSKDEQYIYLANGFSGLTIIDISNPYSPKVLSSIAVDGWVRGVQTLFDEKYILVCQAEKGLVSVINIEDKSTPYIFAKYDNFGEHAFSITATPDQSNALLLGEKGLRILPLKSEFSIHSEFKVLQTSSSGVSTWINLQDTQKLKIGSTIRITFADVFSERAIIFENALYYSEFESKALPSYMSFVSSLKQLTMEVDKEGISGSDGRGENIIILILQIQVTYKEVVAINPTLISATLAYGIIQCLINGKYLNPQQFLLSNYSPEIEQSFYLDFYTQLGIPKDPIFTNYDTQIQNGIENLLMSSQVKYPIRFFVETSLLMNKEISNSTITTSSSSVVVLFTIIRNSSGNLNAEFIKKSFQGVLAVYSDEKDKLKLEGSLSNVNLILNQKVQIANFTSLETISIQSVISDGKNNDIDEINTIDQLKFFKLNQPVRLKQPIQSQLNAQYTDGQLYVVEQFSFRISSDTFVDDDSDNLSPLEYRAYLVLANGSLEEILSGGEIMQFNSAERIIYGSVPSSQLFSEYRIKVIATDGYLSDSDEFVMEFSKMPMALVIEILMKVIGPIIGVFGIWNYRVFLQRLFMKHQYQFQTEIAVIDQEYNKTILIEPSLYADFTKLWNSYKSQHRIVLSEIYEDYEHNYEDLLHRTISDLERLFTLNTRGYPSIILEDFTTEGSRLRTMTSYYLLQIFVCNKNNAYTRESFYLLRNHIKKVQKCNHDWYKALVRILPLPVPDSTVQDEIIEIQSEENQILLSSNQQLLSSEKQLNNEQIGLHSGSIQLNISQSCKIEIEGEVGDGDQVKELEIPEMVRPPIVQDQMKLSRRRHSLSGSLKANLVRSSPYPEIEFDQEGIKKVLAILGRKDYNLNIIFEMLRFEVYGISSEKPFILNPARGETLFMQPQHINSVQAFVLLDQCCLGLKRFLEIDRSPIPVYKNSRLPLWLKLKVINNVIYLSGTPEQNDKENLQIRISDSYGFTILQYNLNIVEGQKRRVNQQPILVKDEIKTKSEKNDMGEVKVINLDMIGSMAKSKMAMIGSLAKSNLNMIGSLAKQNLNKVGTPSQKNRIQHRKSSRDSTISIHESQQGEYNEECNGIDIKVQKPFESTANFMKDKAGSAKIISEPSSSNSIPQFSFSPSYNLKSDQCFFEIRNTKKSEIK